MVAQHYISIGPMYCIIWCFWLQDGKRHQHNAAVSKHHTITQYCFKEWASVEYCGSTLKQHWVIATSLRKVYSRLSDGLVLGQPRRRLTGIEPAMGCDADPTLNRNLVVHDVGLHPLYKVHFRQLLNECWPARAMVVEGIHVEDINLNLSPWFFP